jgi:hemerythrin superfamily protein
VSNAIEMLVADHRKVEQLFDRYDVSRDAAVVRDICTELTVHAALEEKVIYPILSADVERGVAMRRHAEEEHQEVKDAIFEIERLGYGAPGVDQYMQKIIEGVKEHVSEEESEVLPKLRRTLDLYQLAKVTEQAEAAKEQLMTEARTAGPLIDLTKDKLYQLAKEKDIPGRSDMTKEQLKDALKASCAAGSVLVAVAVIGPHGSKDGVHRRRGDQPRRQAAKKDKCGIQPREGAFGHRGEHGESEAAEDGTDRVTVRLPGAFLALDERERRRQDCREGQKDAAETGSHRLGDDARHYRDDRPQGEPYQQLLGPGAADPRDVRARPHVTPGGVSGHR